MRQVWGPVLLAIRPPRELSGLHQIERWRLASEGDPRQLGRVGIEHLRDTEWHDQDRNDSLTMVASQ